MPVNFNDSSEFIKDIKIFNDGKAGVVENVRMRIEKKASTSPDDKMPNYKLIAADDRGEVNEGYYYQEPDSDAFNKYQAQRLIMLARGVFGEDVKFPVFNNPTEALDGIMKMVAPELGKKVWRVAVCYGTTKRKAAYLGFKPFGSFIQSMIEENTLSLGAGDSTERAPMKEATPASELISSLGKEDTGLSWMDAK